MNYPKKITRVIFAIGLFSIFSYGAFAQTAGTLSTTSATGLLTTDTTPPSAPLVNPPKVSSTSISISWAPSTDNVGVVGYDIYRNDIQVGTTQMLSYVDTAVSPGILYLYTVVAYDAARNMSLRGGPVSVTIPALAIGAYPATTTTTISTTSTTSPLLVVDVIPPSSPIVWTPIISSTTIAIAWAASLDNVGVIGYNIYRNNILIGHTQGLSYLDSVGLSSGVQYLYTIEAFDAAKNISLRSAPVSAVIPLPTTVALSNLNILPSSTTSATGLLTTDTIPPSVPLVNPPKVSLTSISISWAPSTDNVGVVGYSISRNDVIVSTTQALSYIDSSILTPGVLYTYVVVAHDAARNMSLRSVPVSAMIPVVQTYVNPPVISLVSQIDNATGTGTQIRWTTDQPTSSYLSYGTASGVYNFSVKSNNCQAVTNAVDHCVNITGLLSGTSYHYHVSAFNGNNLSSVSPEYLFAAPGALSLPAAAATSSTAIIPPAATTTTAPIASAPRISAPRPVAINPTTIYVPMASSNTPTIPQDNSTTRTAPVFGYMKQTVVHMPTPIKPEVSIKDGAKISGKTEIYAKFPDTVPSVEVRLLRPGVTSPFYLGRAQFDILSDRFVFSWDSTHTPDGQYVLTVSPSGEMSQGVEVTVMVGNENNNGKVAQSNITNATTTSAFITRPATDVQKVVDEIRKEQQQKEAQIKNELVGVLGKYAQGGSVNTDGIGKIITEKSQEIKSAVLSGDITKKDEIVAAIVSSGGSSVASNDAFKKEVEVQVARLAQVADEQKNGVVDNTKFSVDTIKVAEVAKKIDGTETAQKLAFHGKALPNSFATLYIYSIPILVTVKTDSDGYWNYTLDKELEDGKHQVFVAITDVKGQVVSKSSPVPFVKVASAVTVEQASAATLEEQPTPGFAESNYFYGIAFGIALVIILVLVFIGVKRSKEPTLS